MSNKRIRLLAKIMEEERLFKMAQGIEQDTGEIDKETADRMAQEIFDQLFQEEVDRILQEEISESLE